MPRAPSSRIYVFMVDFRVNARRFLLTYPRSDLNANLLYEFFKQLPVAPNRAIIARERHQDGEWHVHVALELSRRLNSTRVSIFDFAGRHPNISVARTWGACVNYCRKAGTVETTYHDCTAETAAVGGSSRRGSDEDPYTTAAGCSTIREWYTHCLAESIPYAFANAIWNQLHGPRPPTFFANVDEGRITHATLSALPWDPSWHTLVLCGPSGIGKTTWALKTAPVPFLFVTDVDDLGHFDPQVHKAIVFDEVRCTGDVTGKGAWPLTSQIKLVTWDTPVSIRIRYKIAHIPAQIPKVFTSTDFFPVNGDAQIKRRVTAINLYENTAVSALWI